MYAAKLIAAFAGLAGTADAVRVATPVSDAVSPPSTFSVVQSCCLPLSLLLLLPSNKKWEICPPYHSPLLSSWPTMPPVPTLTIWSEHHLLDQAPLPSSPRPGAFRAVAIYFISLIIIYHIFDQHELTQFHTCNPNLITSVWPPSPLEKLNKDGPPRPTPPAVSSPVYSAQCTSLAWEVGAKTRYHICCFCFGVLL